MRAYEFLNEEALDEGKMKDLLDRGILGPVAYGTAMAGLAAASHAGILPASDQERREQQQQQQQQQQQDGEERGEDGSVTIPLAPATPYVAKDDHEEQQAKAPSKEAATLLALTIWGEARSHGEPGMRAVGHVILNRMASDRNFGDSLKEVIWKRKHFSCWNPSDPNREAMKKIEQLPKTSLDYKRWQQAKKLAVKLLSGHDKDITRGALFYHTDYIKKPAWALGQKAVATVANHIFYKDDRKA